MTPYTLDDERADKAFLAVSRLICDYRDANPLVTDAEVAYALLQISAAIGSNVNYWFDFLTEALQECINVEGNES